MSKNKLVVQALNNDKLFKFVCPEWEYTKNDKTEDYMLFLPFCWYRIYRFVPNDTDINKWEIFYAIESEDFERTKIYFETQNVEEIKQAALEHYFKIFSSVFIKIN
jgi:hypothetical protein